MEVKTEDLGKNVAQLTVRVPQDEFKKAVVKSYNKNKSRYRVNGFRPGHAPQAVIEKIYGKGAFYEDAVNICIDETYPDAIKESKLDIVTRPEIDVTQIDADKDLIYTAKVAVKPSVELGEYKGVTVDKASTEVTDADIDEELKKEQEKNARMIDDDTKSAEIGDYTTIDFDGSIDGVQFDGGKAENYPLELGSHSFIEGFEDQIVGHKVGDEFDVNVTFPEEYHAENLSGKAAIFKVKLNSIKRKELPELNDEFASEVSEFDTLAAWKEDIKKKLVDIKQRQATTENENNVIAKVAENAQMDIPDMMIDAQVDRMVNEYARNMQSQGISFEQYMQITGMTIDKIREQMREDATKRIRISLTIEAVKDKENIQVSDEAFEKHIQEMAARYKMDEDKLRQSLGESGEKRIREDLNMQETVDFLVGEAKLV